jgi:branched-chain amino acid transport system ATP-binding protein
MAELEIQKLTKHFGGLVAVKDVDLKISNGEVVGIIGPNGAGKTTLINLISGIISPTSGNIIYNGKDITGVPAHDRSSMGIARTYQLIHPLENLNLKENIMVGFVFAQKMALKKAAREAELLCEYLGLKEPDRPVGKLNILEIKLMEIAHALATGPSILFLDEIMAGLNTDETMKLIKLVKRIAEERNLGIGVVEHVMGVIKETTTRVIVLDACQIIAAGEYSEVVKIPEVIRAYLGGSV